MRGTPVTGVAAADAAEAMARVDVNEEEEGLALAGYDCVSYHTLGSPALGKQTEDCEVFTENVLQGRVRYRFATRENAELFRRSHFAVFAPRYGGFCAAGWDEPANDRETSSLPAFLELNLGQSEQAHGVLRRSSGAGADASPASSLVKRFSTASSIRWTVRAGHPTPRDRRR